MKRQCRLAVLTACCLASITAGCSSQPQPAADTRAADEAAIREADAAWSKAFGAMQLDAAVSYNADDATMLPPNMPAASGKDAIRKIYAQLFAIPGFSIGWQPEKVEVARSGDLGYSQGIYELAMNDADQCLPRRQRSHDLLADCLIFDDGDEIADHRQRDVGFEQRKTHFAERVLNIGVGEACLAAQRFYDARKARCEVVEHR